MEAWAGEMYGNEGMGRLRESQNISRNLAESRARRRVITNT